MCSHGNHKHCSSWNSNLATAGRSRDICTAENLSEMVFFSLKDLKPHCSFSNQGCAHLWETLKFPTSPFLPTITEGAVYIKEDEGTESQCSRVCEHMYPSAESHLTHHRPLTSIFWLIHSFNKYFECPLCAGMRQTRYISYGAYMIPVVALFLHISIRIIKYPFTSAF